MLRFVRRTVGDRQFALFATAYCRHLLKVLEDQRFARAVALVEGFDTRCRLAIDALERLADGEVLVGELMNCERDLYSDYFEIDAGAQGQIDQLNQGLWIPAPALIHLLILLLREERGARSKARECIRAAVRLDRFGMLENAETHMQCDLLRCVIRNPFHSFIHDVNLLGWNGDTVKKLAQWIYDQNCFERLGILGDALEEAGCTDNRVLSHCRDPRPHVRGCWAVDLILGKDR
jgi:hypothetical protein